ncbi:MAG: hypothetical protein ABSB50_21220 [Terracidiphilus sp.]|jgi:hypothetical protein
MRQRKTAIWAKWRGLVAEQEQSGQRAAAFCRERGLRSGQFFAWKKRLREAEEAQFLAVELRPTEAVAQPVPVMHRGTIEVRLGRGRSLVVEPGFDTCHLRALLSVLEA